MLKKVDAFLNFEFFNLFFLFLIKNWPQVQLEIPAITLQFIWKGLNKWDQNFQLLKFISSCSERFQKSWKNKFLPDALERLENLMHWILWFTLCSYQVFLNKCSINSIFLNPGENNFLEPPRRLENKIDQFACKY